MGALALVLALSTGLAADAGASLTTLAAATNRPPECSLLVPRSGARKPSVWRLARMPTLGAYCDDLARSHAQLSSDPKAALAAAESADGALPDHASASVAMARARLALGDVKGALEAFRRALELDKRSLDEPKAMSDYARALVLGGEPASSAGLYRALVPRAELLPDGARPLVYLQAAHALMAHAAFASAPREAATDLADAAAYLAEARDATTLRGDVLLSLALVFDRAGDAEKAAAALSEAQRAGAALSDQGKAYVAFLGDAHALAALAAEALGRPSSDEWTQFLDGAPPPAWVTAAKAHLGAGKSSGRRPKKGEPPKAEPEKKGARR